MALRAGDDVGRFFDEIEEQLHAGRWLAGYLSYELGLLLEPSLADLAVAVREGTMLAWMGVFEGPRRVNGPLQSVEAAPFGLRDLVLDASAEAYGGTVGCIHEAIRAGETYQVNYTMRYGFKLEGTPEALYLGLRERQRVSYGACLSDGERTIVSLSPELFLARDGRRVWMRPMKGTAVRGGSRRADAEQVRWLGADEKNRAENVMIVDMVRNDLGRVAETGSVTAEDLLRVERYETVHQMTSTVHARLHAGVSWLEVLRATFPCASVTGAPKVATMRLISEIETSPRGVYTGAIGYIAPNGRARFSVGIRTITVDGSGRGEMGVGSGVVIDSDAAAEYEECRLKAAFLSGAAPELRLVETMRVENGRVRHLGDHLSRLSRSAAELGFGCRVSRVRAACRESARWLGSGTFRLRLTLRADGEVNMEDMPLEVVASSPVRVMLADAIADSRAALRGHKTSPRLGYDAALVEARARGFWDAIFMNERGEVTEGARSNVFVEIDGTLCTPPVSCGLLPGTLRARLLRSGECRERVLTRDDLFRASRVFVGNALRGLLEAEVVP
ncbi:MAG: aminodeoxychorismate synthase component I [Candidatus Krumholzibacteria bacterium]|nr:aminodeoxychorismate synthase component I [Candidatus Krumholzibacteria bacterium]